jgi:hypothetical protein
MAVFMFSSCEDSSNKKSEVKTPKSTTLKGGLKEYFEAVDKEYKIVSNGSWGNLITVEIKRNSTKFPFSTKKVNPFGTDGIGEYKEDFHVGFGIEIFDESDSPIVIKNATEGGFGGPYSSDDVEGLMKLEEGETGFIRWSVDLEDAKTYKTFQISSALEKSDGSTNSSYSSFSSSSSEDWDAVLKSYESYIDNTLS